MALQPGSTQAVARSPHPVGPHPRLFRILALALVARSGWQLSGQQRAPAWLGLGASVSSLLNLKRPPARPGQPRGAPEVGLQGKGEALLLSLVLASEP